MNVSWIHELMSAANNELAFLFPKAPQVPGFLFPVFISTGYFKIRTHENNEVRGLGKKLWKRREPNNTIQDFRTTFPLRINLLFCKVNLM